MLKKFKPPNGDTDKIRFGIQMNVGHILIENTFSLLKVRWHLLKSVRTFVIAQNCVCLLHFTFFWSIYR